MARRGGVLSQLTHGELPGCEERAPTLRTEKFSGLYAPLTAGMSGVSTPTHRTEDRVSAGAPVARRRGEQAQVEDLSPLCQACIRVVPLHVRAET